MSENDNVDDLTMQNNPGPSGGDLAQKGANAAMRTADNARKMANRAKDAKKAADAAKAVGSASKAAALAGTPVGWVILAILLIIIIAIIGFGLYAYTMGVWGSIMEKLKDWGTSVWTSFKGAVIGQAEALVTKDQIIEVANYIEEMGYDLEGSGLVTGRIIRESDVVFSGEEDENGNREWTLKEGITYKDLDSIKHQSDGKIVYVDSLYLKTYLISDNLPYLIKNFNQPFVGIIEGVVAAVANWGEDYYRTDSLDNSDIIMSSIGEGLIVLYKFDKSTGEITAYNSAEDNWDEFWNNLNFINILTGNVHDNEHDEIKINKDSKTLSLKRGIGNNSFTFNLDGWTGRYGMPLEFLLSVHMATMAPDLAYTLATSFNTEVRLALMPLTGKTIEGAIQLPRVGYVTSATLEGYFRDNFISTLIGDLFEDIDVSKAEIDDLLNTEYFGGEIVFDKETDEDFASMLNEKLPDFVSYIEGAGYAISYKGVSSFFHDAFVAVKYAIDNSNFSTYVPFIMEVSDHWYRDVYFTLSENRFSDVVADGGFVEVDQEYLEESEERWTLYTYKEVEYKDEQTGQEFAENKYIIITEEMVEENQEGSIEVENVATGEKNVVAQGTLEESDIGTKLIDYLDESELKDAGNTGFDLSSHFYWSAYEFTEGSGSVYEPVNTDLIASTFPNFKEAADAGNDYLFAKHDFANAVAQKEDGLRGSTNPKIKEIFNDKYYIYDGTEATANAIELDKVNALSTAANDGVNALEKIKDAMLDAVLGVEDNILRDIIEWTLPTFTFAVDEDGFLTLQVNDGEPTVIAIGVSKWVSDLLPEGYKDAELFKQVEINKDSLTAFSILENTETLDADYIYKDFKELLVELDYFDKEELRETIVPVFQWLYEETGSAGWPVKKWEKDAVEYGTIIHSKVNLDYLKDEEYKAQMQSGDNSSGASSSSKPKKIPTKRLTNYLSEEEFLEVAEEVHKVMEDLEYHYCLADGSESNDHPGKGTPGGCGLDHPFERSKTGHQLSCCSTYVSWVLEEAEMNIPADDPDSPYITDGASSLYNWYSDYFTEVSSYDDLEAGDLIFQSVRQSGCEGDITKIGHVQICAGKDQWYNAGSTEAIQRNSPYTDTSYARSTFVIGLRPSCRKEITPFEGFEKDDLVLSPATGRIIRIGTIGEDSLIYATADDDRELEIVKMENENPDNEYVEGLNYIEIEVLDLEDPDSILSGQDDDTKAGYKMFLEDYIAQNCNGYIIRIEGYIHELDLASISSADNKFIPPETTEYLTKAKKEARAKEIEKLENASPGFIAGGEYYIKEGTVLGKTTDCNMKITMFNLEESIAENVEEYMEIDEEEIFPRQPYVAQEGDLILLANVMHKENCSLSLAGGYNMTEVEAIAGNKGTGYVIINRALVNYGGHGTTIRDQIGAPGQYATSYLLNTDTVLCQTCLEAAEWCLTWDCMSCVNQNGEQMERHVLSQSGWCFCDGNPDPGLNCWLYLDTVRKGTVEEHTDAEPTIFDEFFCKNPAYEGYP